MKTVVFMPIGLGLAHCGRLIMIARELKKSGVNIIFGAGTDAISLLKREGMQFLEIPEFTKDVYDKKMKNSNPFVYTSEIIEEFVTAELNLYRKIKPDLIVYDARFTAKISAEIAGIRTVSVVNANMTPYYDFSKVKFPFNTLFAKFLPEQMIRLLNKNYGQKLMRQIGPKIIQAILIGAMINLFPTLIKLGYKIGKNPYQLILGDITLLTDIPEYRPMKKLPANVKAVGPIFWDGGCKLPTWTEKVKKNKNIIYITAGGTGDKNIFIKLLKYLEKSGYTIIATTGNTLNPEEVKVKYPNLFVTDYLPGEFILSRAKIIIFPGGNSSCYQALNFGVPQVLIPMHVDQEDNANQLERLGTGIMVNPYNGLVKDRLLNTISRIMTNKTYKQNAERMQKILKAYNGPVHAAKIINNLLNQN